jgi:hypothetical protein
VGTWDRLRAALRREKGDAKELLDELTARADAALDQRERDLRATPIERLEREQARSEEIDADLEAVRRRIERAGES